MADDSCNKPLRMVASLPMTIDNQVVTVPISVNGQVKRFLVDTGGAYPQISAKIVEELHLEKKDSPLQLYGVDGTVSKTYTIADISIGRMLAPKMELQISDKSRVDGILTPPTFAAYDFDFDFGGGKFNMLSNDHCDGKVVYWQYQALAIVPLRIDDSHHITVPVTVDGQRMTAIIDTGAGASTMRLDMAQRKFGLTTDSADMKIVGYLDDAKKAPVYAHHFQTLAFDGINVANPEISILTDIVNKNADHSFRAGSNIHRASDELTLPEVIVGMDVLTKLHVYIALKEKKLYITEAGNPPKPQ